MTVREALAWKALTRPEEGRTTVPETLALFWGRSAIPLGTFQQATARSDLVRVLGNIADPVRRLQVLHGVPPRAPPSEEAFARLSTTQPIVTLGMLTDAVRTWTPGNAN